MEKIIEEAKRVLLKPENVEDWSLGLVTLVKMGIQILDSETRMDLVWRLLSFIVEVVSEVVQLDMEEFVVLGLEYLESFLFRDKDFYGYINNQWKFVSSIMYKIREFGSKITEAARRIHRFVRSGNEDPQENEDRGESGNANISDRECFEHLNSLSLLEIVGIFASDGQEEKYKDMVIRRIQLLLSDENRNKAEIDVSVMRKLQPLLVSCLTKGVSESMFKVLGEVVYHVAYEMMHVRDETWIGLRDYLVAQSKTEFQRAVYIFQCLKMPLDEQEFVIPVMESLLPEINTRLNPPSEVLVDNSGWVLAFTGAFCAVIHLIEVEDSAESVKDIAYKMIGSVRELVEKGMEVGLVMRAFRDVESIVKKHLEWFTTNEYKFVKAMARTKNPSFQVDETPQIEEENEEEVNCGDEESNEESGSEEEANEGFGDKEEQVSDKEEEEVERSGSEEEEEEMRKAKH
ncbi:hypothetical protein AALP_AA2G027400 [Arabis alpina]|uniref:DUF577 domain-containing protein n=1 Tax=Arabis alpina TaxID=50452 RepID=A0A087HEX8_ARAAL|nr:hypothetical protein AALP_AA2G027400 [Arabis alpina]